MTRALIADPYFPKKVSEGRVQDVRSCIGTLEGCWGNQQPTTTRCGARSTPRSGGKLKEEKAGYNVLHSRKKFL